VAEAKLVIAARDWNRESFISRGSRLMDLGLIETYREPLGRSSSNKGVFINN
jgi:hypothetical protein